MGKNGNIASDCSRVIGIRNRVLQTAEGEPRPTQVAIFDNSGNLLSEIELETEDMELDFIRGILPVSYRNADPNEDLAKFPKHHLKVKKLKKDEERSKYPEKLLFQANKEWFVITKVPEKYDGLKQGDILAMILGGTGDHFSFAASKKPGVKVFRVKPSLLKEWRKDGSKDNDGALLAEKFLSQSEEFQLITARDQELIELRRYYRQRTDAMKALVAATLRLRQTTRNAVFYIKDGNYPDGTIDERFEQAKLSDPIYVALSKEKELREKELTKFLESLPLYQMLFVPIEGLGPMIAARIIVGIEHIGRFDTAPQFKAFSGVHVLAGGKYSKIAKEHQFPRRRSGMVANWHPDVRQALYLFGVQCNKRPESEWGKKLREYKAQLRQKHPEPVEIVLSDGKKVTRYYDGHIQKMAIRKTLTKFAEYLFNAWKKVEKELAAQD